MGGDLIDHGPAVFGVAPCFMEGTLRGHSGHAFIPEDHFDGGYPGAEACGERFHFLGGRPSAAVHVFGKPEDDGVHRAFADHRADAVQGRFGGGNGFEGMGEHPEVV